MRSQDAPSVQNQTADPKPACDPATLGNVDAEFELLDVTSSMAAKGNMGSFRDYVLPPERLSRLSPEKRLELLQKHLEVKIGCRIAHWPLSRVSQGTGIAEQHIAGQIAREHIARHKCVSICCAIRSFNICATLPCEGLRNQRQTAAQKQKIGQHVAGCLSIRCGTFLVTNAARSCLIPTLRSLPRVPPILANLSSASVR